MVGLPELVLVAVVPLVVGCFPEDGLDDDDNDEYVVVPAGGADATSDVARRRLDMGTVVVAPAVKYPAGPAVAVAVAGAGGDFLRAGGLQS